MVAVDALMEGADVAGRADLEAMIDGRELPSVARARVEQMLQEEQEKEARRGQIARFMAASKTIDRGPHVL